MLQDIENKTFNFNVDGVNDQGITPLMFACVVGDLPIVKLLIEHGANKHLRNNLPSKIAKKFNHPHIVRYLDGEKTNSCFFCF